MNNNWNIFYNIITLCINKKMKEKIKTIEEIKRVLKNLKEEVREKYKAEIVGIFGSYVKGKQRKKSDLDVLVKFYEGATIFDLIGLSIFLEEKLGIKKVDVVPYDTLREEIKDKVFKEVVYL